MTIRPSIASVAALNFKFPLETNIETASENRDARFDLREREKERERGGGRKEKQRPSIRLTE